MVNFDATDSNFEAHYDMLAAYVATTNVTTKATHLLGEKSYFIYGQEQDGILPQLVMEKLFSTSLVHVGEVPPKPLGSEWDYLRSMERTGKELLYLFIFRDTLLGVYGRIYTSMGPIQYFWVQLVNSNIFEEYMEWATLLWECFREFLQWCLFALAGLAIATCLVSIFQGVASGWVAIMGCGNVILSYTSGLQMVILMGMIHPTSAVPTCSTCFDQVAGCAGGAACIFLTQAAGNLAALAAGAAGIISVANMLPISYLRQLPSSVVRTLTVIARRPVNGAPPDVGAMTLTELQDNYDQGTIDMNTMRSELSVRLTDPATAAAMVTRISAVIANAANAPVGNPLSLSTGIGGISTVGAISYLVAVASLITRQGATTYSVGVSGAVSTAPTGNTIKITTPTSFAGFSELLMVWQTLGHATGAASILASARFLQEVVWDAMKSLGVDWQTAYCMFLVYIEAIEHSAGLLHLGNVFSAGGSQDTRLTAARQRRADLFPPPPPPPPPPIIPGGGGDTTTGKKWNDKDSPNASRICHTFNFKDAKHPAKHLYSDGCCKFKHVCMHWVSDKGKGGMCEGDHPKYLCTNPNKCATAIP